MDILMLSWEYPPINHGGLARHVQDLSEALVEAGHQVYVITQGDEKTSKEEKINGVNVIRTDPVQISAKGFVNNILHLNFQLLEKAIKLVNQIDTIDIIHGHDWLVFWAGKVLKHSLIKPLVYTIHATEFGRNQGIYNDMQRYINDLEWYATFEAWNVIVCSKYMESEVKNLFQLPSDKVFNIPNGVNPENYQADFSSAFREKYAAPDEKMVYYVGRMVREKGVQVLIQAIPEILHYEPQTKFVIAGKGPHLDNLKSQARFLGIENRIYFTGFISDDVRNKLYRVADVAVFPSLYEPFGIVALEAMATKTPVIVSDVGGLAEFVNEKNGIKVPPNNPHELARAVITLFRDNNKAKKMSELAYRMVTEEYSWERVAAKTIRVYEKVLREYNESDWNKIESERPFQKDEESLIYRYLSKKKYS